MSQFYYFTPCCGEEPFGIRNNTNPLTLWTNFTNIVGRVYGLRIDSFSGCVTYSGSSTTPIEGLSFYNSTPIFAIYNSCSFCTEYIFPCRPPNNNNNNPIIGYRNECGVITILPMGVRCVTTNPSTSLSSDGIVSLSISGGSAPYTVTWIGGPISPTYNNLPNGSYTATTVDYWGDYSATTVCTIYTPPDCTFSATIEQVFPEECIDTGLAGYTFDLT